MNVPVRALLLSQIIIASASNAWAVITKGQGRGAEYLAYGSALLGAVIAILGLVLVFRGVKSPADVSIELSGIGKLSMTRVGQGVVLVVVGAAISLLSIYFYPREVKKEILEKEIVTTEEGKMQEKIHYELR